jgi:hypothetical protein
LVWLEKADRLVPAYRQVCPLRELSWPSFLLKLQGTTKARLKWFCRSAYV